MEKINNIFIEIPNRETYEEYKNEINPDSLVFIQDEDRMIGNDKEYQFASIEGFVKLIDNNDNVVETVPVLKRKVSGYGYGYGYTSPYQLGDWDEPIVI